MGRWAGWRARLPCSSQQAAVSGRACEAAAARARPPTFPPGPPHWPTAGPRTSRGVQAGPRSAPDGAEHARPQHQRLPPRLHRRRQLHHEAPQRRAQQSLHRARVPADAAGVGCMPARAWMRARRGVHASGCGRRCRGLPGRARPSVGVQHMPLPLHKLHAASDRLMPALPCWGVTHPTSALSPAQHAAGAGQVEERCLAGKHVVPGGQQVPVLPKLACGHRVGSSQGRPLLPRRHRQAPAACIKQVRPGAAARLAPGCLHAPHAQCAHKGGFAVPTHPRTGTHP